MDVSHVFTVGRTIVFKVGIIKFIQIAMHLSKSVALLGRISNSARSILIQAGLALKPLLIPNTR